MMLSDWIVLLGFERILRNTVRERNKTMQGLQNDDTATEFTKDSRRSITT
ncbi:hypothetical protein MNV_900002 [Candidatus Methanoperedens nitroreducens]|uniref:Uncharacterized protein n=1 Tax=Candidatus Methanoperedens nitratireducens TaxID=1392998 RepID=A0A284VUG9_9EURY|nr:hypothetical protein MNV_900002 [Candidatus Methanoperedens nitroreducens]